MPPSPPIFSTSAFAVNIPFTNIRAFDISSPVLLSAVTVTAASSSAPVLVTTTYPVLMPVLSISASHPGVSQEHITSVASSHPTTSYAILAVSPVTQVAPSASVKIMSMSSKVDMGNVSPLSKTRCRNEPFLYTSSKMYFPGETACSSISDKSFHVAPASPLIIQRPSFAHILGASSPSSTGTVLPPMESHLPSRVQYHLPFSSCAALICGTPLLSFPSFRHHISADVPALNLTEYVA